MRFINHILYIHGIVQNLMDFDPSMNPPRIFFNHTYDAWTSELFQRMSYCLNVDVIFSETIYQATFKNNPHNGKTRFQIFPNLTYA